MQKLAEHPRRRDTEAPRARSSLAPTRELAAQIGQSFHHYGKHLRLSHAVIFGGVGQHGQVQALDRGVDILVATPGRLLDLQQQKHVFFDKVEVFVLDEADRMLDMGFVHDVKRVNRPPAAEAPVAAFFRDHAAGHPGTRRVAGAQSRARRSDARRHHGRAHSSSTSPSSIAAIMIKLLAHLVGEQREGLVIVFVRMKHMANKLAEQLAKHEIRAESHPRQTSPRTPARGRWTTFPHRPQPCARGHRHRRTRHRREGHLPSSLTFDLPENRSPTCIASAAPRAPAATASPVAFCDDTERPPAAPDRAAHPPARSGAQGSSLRSVRDLRAARGACPARRRHRPRAPAERRLASPRRRRWRLSAGRFRR
ncbi:MAG: DEAD/DEAH box helicase [Verrucomicrobiota bacterium]